MASEDFRAAIVKTLKATASELHGRPPEETNADWADVMAQALLDLGVQEAEVPDEVIVYRAGPSASWELIGGPRGFGAVLVDTVLAEAARLAIDRPGLVIRYKDRGSLRLRRLVAQEESP